MQLGILAARDQVAQEKIIAAANTLAQRFGLDMTVNPRRINGRDPRIGAMEQREEVAALLEALVGKTTPPEPATSAALRKRGA